MAAASGLPECERPKDDPLTSSALCGCTPHPSDLCRRVPVQHVKWKSYWNSARVYWPYICDGVSVCVRRVYLPWTLLWLLLTLRTCIMAHPTSTRSRVSLTSNVVDFLTKYGYLPESDLETGNLRTESQLREAIRTMQQFAGLAATGDIDEATQRLMKRPRCGLPDIVSSADRVKRYALQGGKWNKTDLTWSIGQRISSMEHNTMRQEISKALKIWSDASKLTFTEVSDPLQSDIVIAFHRGYHGDGYPFDGPGAVLAHAFFPGEGRGGDTHFDDEENWIVSIHNSEEGVSLLAVAAHEFGHSLGLAHSSEEDALMFPYYQGIRPNMELPRDDRVGIQQLYGSREERPWAPLTPYDPAKTPHKPPVTGRTTPNPRGAPAAPAIPNDDDESVATHKPDTCDTDYDAISVIRNEVFIFKGNYFWRLDDRGLKKGYPVEINRFWFNLPKNLSHIDAVYERPQDKRIVFFVGRQHWMFEANNPLPGYPKPLTALGLPADIPKINAAMVWGHNGKTYFFSGTMYWRFDEDEQRVELDYPRDMVMWRGVPYNIDAAFQWTDGKTYFFKGKAFWKFNNQRMRVQNQAPALSAPFWMSCPQKPTEKPNNRGYPNVESNDIPNVGTKREGSLGKSSAREGVDTSATQRISSSTGLITLLLMLTYYLFVESNRRL